MNDDKLPALGSQDNLDLGRVIKEVLYDIGTYRSCQLVGNPQIIKIKKTIIVFSV